MILPNPINYKNNRVSIRYMSNYDSLKLKAYGLYDPNKKAILLYKNLNKKELLNTFLHELMHLIGDKSKYKIRNFSEEKVNFPFYSLLEIFYINGIYGVHVFYTISGFVFAYIYLSSNKKIHEDLLFQVYKMDRKILMGHIPIRL